VALKNKNEEIPIVFRRSEVLKIFRISAQRLAALIRRGDIRIIRLGREVVIPRSEVERILGQDLRYVDLIGMGIRLKGIRRLPVRRGEIR